MPPQRPPGWSHPDLIPFSAPDVEHAGDGPETLHYFRRRDLVVPVEQEGRAREILRQGWRRRWDAGDARDEIGFVGLRADVRPRGGIREELERVRAGGVPDAQLNHVLVGQPRYQGFPLAQPVPHDPPRTPHEAGEFQPLVVVVDTGVSPDSPIVAGGMVDWDDPDDREWLDADADGRLDLQGGHATFIAGVVRARCPWARVRVVRALDRRGVGDDLSVAEALRRVPHDADIVNLSFGGYAEKDVRPRALAAALARIRDRGALVLAAAGNDGLDRPLWPAGSARAEVVAVGAATDASGSWVRSAYSNHGDWVDAFCPGDQVVSAFVDFDAAGLGDDYRGGARGDGTSFAAPALAGMVAAEMTGPGDADAALGRLRPAGTVDGRPVYA